MTQHASATRVPDPNMHRRVRRTLTNARERRSESAIDSIQVVVGGQFGSEAKGHVTQQVVRRASGNPNTPVLNIRVAGPNAGHTVVAATGLPGDSSDERTGETSFAFRQLPVGIVEDPLSVVCAIAAGSEIELPVLLGEIALVQQAGLWPAERLLVVDPEATLLREDHKRREAGAGLVERIGSTGKGIGAARADRIMRKPDLRLGDDWASVAALERVGVVIAPVSKLYSVPKQAVAPMRYQVVIEGTQGYGLGLHAGHYPKTTSSDCRAIDFLGMAGLSPWQLAGGVRAFKVWVVVRPFPIRVAGDSGPLLDETTWEELGLTPEKTTVTKKVRRVGRWDEALAREAVRANGGGHDHTARTVVLALSMADQIDPNVAGETDPTGLYDSSRVESFVAAIQSQTGALVDLVTTSPSTCTWLA